MTSTSLALGRAAVVVLRDRGVALLARTVAGPGDPQPASVTATRVTAANVTAAGSAPFVRSLIGLTGLFLCC